MAEVCRNERVRVISAAPFIAYGIGETMRFTDGSVWRVECAEEASGRVLWVLSRRPWLERWWQLLKFVPASFWRVVDWCYPYA